jgi:hypothetical protein
MNGDIQAFNEKLESSEREICELLAVEIDKRLPEAQSKIWHRHPVWFLEDNPTVGYSKLEAGVRLLFWSGADFGEERPGKTCFRFWQEGPGYDRNLTTSTAIEAAIEYIHMNPVRRGMVNRAVDWRWSSASWYLLDPPRQQLLRLPVIHGMPVGTLD